MKDVLDETLKQAYKPYDIVTNEKGHVGFIKETNINECQEEPKHQISYSVEWVVGGELEKTAWYTHMELKKHCNIFVKIAECSCHPFGDNRRKVERLMNLGI